MQAPVILRRFHERELQICSAVGWTMSVATLSLGMARVITGDKKYTKAALRVGVARIWQAWYESLLRKQLNDPLMDPTILTQDLTGMLDEIAQRFDGQ